MSKAPPIRNRPHPHPHHKQPLTPTRHHHHPTLEERIVAPRPPERRQPRIIRHRIEEPDLHRILHIADVQHPQPAHQVRLVQPVPPHVLVVVDRPRLGEVLLQQQRVAQIGHVPDQRPRPVAAALDLVQLVAHEEVALVLGQPALVRAAGLAAHAAPDRVRRPRLLVDDDVVGAVDAVVAGGLGEGHRRARGVPELGEVEDLHAVRSGAVGDDEGVVAVHLDVAPEVLGGALGQGQLAGVAGVGGVADVDEGRGVRAPDQRPVLAGHRVGPSPDVVS